MAKKEAALSCDIKEKDCSLCNEVKVKYKKINTLPDFFILHFNRSDITPTNKHEGKKTKAEAQFVIAKTVSALRNHSGGLIIIHLKGQDPTDRDFVKVDEFFGKKCSELIENGSLYVDNFSRDWLSELKGFGDYTEFLFLNVKKTNFVCTADFCTRVRNDFENKKPSTLNIVSILSKLFLDKSRVPKETKPVIRGSSSLEFVCENRNIEVKSIKHIDCRKYNDAEKFVDVLWNKLKLEYNVTSLSKVSDGGSVLIGIREKTTTKPYPRTITEVEGFKTAIDIEDIKAKLREKLESSICVLDRTGVFHSPPDDLVDIQFHNVDQMGELKILEISVRHYDGIVFHDVNGPKAYIIVKNEIKAMSRDEWMKRIRFNCPVWKIW